MTTMQLGLLASSAWRSFDILTAHTPHPCGWPGGGGLHRQDGDSSFETRMSARSNVLGIHPFVAHGLRPGYAQARLRAVAYTGKARASRAIPGDRAGGPALSRSLAQG